MLKIAPVVEFVKVKGKHSQLCCHELWSEECLVLIS